LCSKSEFNVANYYDAVKAAYLKVPKSETDDYYPMTIRNYLTERGVNDSNEIDKNLEPLWKFTYWLLNEQYRIKIVNKDPDNLLVAWISSGSANQE
jgi:membrane-anchored protein YejM (alkaline phosphatase superfamily)